MSRKVPSFILAGLIIAVAIWGVDRKSYINVSWNGSLEKFSLLEALILVLVYVILAEFLGNLLERLFKHNPNTLHEVSLRDTDLNILSGKFKGEKQTQDLRWAVESALEARTKQKNWYGALKVLDGAFGKELISIEKYKKYKAIILFEIAKEVKLKGDEENFNRLCQHAVNTDGSLVPAVVLMAKYEKDRKKAAKMLLGAWEKNPVRDLADEYLKIFHGLGPLEKVEKMEHFTSYNRNLPALNNMILAELYSKAGLWAKAKAQFEQFLINNPCTKEMCKMIAKYETNHNNDKKAAKSWQGKIENCAENSAWVCGVCGSAYDKWQATCSNCGAFGKIEWQIYLDVEESLLEEKNLREEDDED